MFGKKIESKISKALKIKIILGLAVLAIILLPILFLIFYIIYNVTPINGFENGMFDVSDRSKKTFPNKILDKEEEWLEKGVQIDKELIVSIALYGKIYGIEDEKAVPCDDPLSDECSELSDSQLKNRDTIRNVATLADGMVKEQTLYTCRNKYITTNTVCDGPSARVQAPTYGGGSGGNSGSSNNCHTETETSYSEWLFCGYDDPSLCDHVCTSSDGHEVNSEIEYNLKTTEEYQTWLKLPSREKDEFGDYGYDLAAKMTKLGRTLPSDPEKKEEKLDRYIDEIYFRYRIAKGNIGFGSTSYWNITDPYAGNYEFWKQKDPAWANVLIGTSATLGDYGCTITSIAIQIKRSGTYINTDYLGTTDFNPGTFAGRIRAGGGFADTGHYRWNNEAAKNIAPNFVFLNKVSLSGTWDSKLSTIASELSKGHFLVLAVKNAGHWVAVTGIDGDKVLIADPGRVPYNYLPSPAYSASGVVMMSIYEKRD